MKQNTGTGYLHSYSFVTWLMVWQNTSNYLL